MDPPSRPAALNKAYSWAHMAGWYADRGCEGFLKALWSDAAVATELQRCLGASGSWTVIELVSGDARG
jgi:hypothetical protein